MRTSQIFKLNQWRVKIFIESHQNMRFTTFWISLCLFIHFTFAQSNGNLGGQFPTRIFLPKEYKGSIVSLCFVQDKTGKIFSGNDKGVSVFDGANWQFIRLPKGQAALWIDVDDQNNVYVGSQEEFGYISNDADTYKYTSLIPLLPDSIDGFGSIWEVANTKNGVYFRSSNYVFWYYDNKIKVLSKEAYPGEKFDVLYRAHGEVWLRKRGYGVGKMINDSLVIPKGGRFFEKIKINAIMALGEDILVATRREGLFLIDEQGTRPFDNEIQDVLAEARIYHAVAHKEYIALATLTQGVFVINKKGQLIEHIDKKRYGISSTTNSVFFDNQDGLWIATVQGIARVDFNDQFRIFRSIAGENMFINGILKKDSIYYFATTTGIYYSETKNFDNAKKINGVNNPCESLKEIDGTIYFDGNSGTYKIDENFEAEIVFGQAKIPFKISGKSNYLLGGQEGLISARRLNDGSFEAIKSFKVGENITSVMEFENGKIWACRTANGISYYDIQNDSLRHFPAFGNSTILTLERQPLFVTDKGVFEYSYSGFIKSNLIYSKIDSTKYFVDHIQVDGQGNVLLIYHDENSNVFGKWLKKQTKYNYQDYSLPDFDLRLSEIISVYLEDEGKVWIAKHDELLLIDVVENETSKDSLNVYLSSIQAGENKFNPALNDQNKFNERSFKFKYAARYFNSYGSNNYQHMLVGLENTWSNWSESSSAAYSYLQEGKYSFKVRAQNPNKIVSDTISYDFTILPPWYRKTWAYILFLFASSLIILLIIRIRSNRLKAENRKLEVLVNERTNEVASKNKKLEEINSLKSKFFANISHELRTPLTLINGQFEAIEAQKNSLEIKDRIVHGKKNVAQLKNMIEDLLDLSKLELGQNLVKPKPTLINDFLSRMTYSFHSFAEKKEIALSYQDNFSTDILVKLDVRQFEKVINNLLFNAIKFTSFKGKVSLTADSDGKYLTIKISDTGKGIETAELPYIFDRFYQAKNQGSEPGSGLGLAIAKEIIDLHGGEIEVSSKVGTGTTFSIKLPLSNAILQKEEIPEDEMNIGDFLEKNIFLGETNKPQILIVEDNDEMRSYLKEILSDNFKINEVTNGQEALEWLKINTAQLIISDVMMPKMGGFELLDRVKQSIKLKNVPVILLTARSSQEDRLHGLRFGVDDYITKPFDRDELLIRAINLIKNLQSRVIIAKDDIEEESDKSKILISQEDEKMVKTAEAYVESRIADSSLSVRELATSVAMSERQFYRKIRQVTGMTPARFMMEIRMHYAHKLLLDGQIVKISQVSSEVGINSASYFSKLFYERFGKRPTSYIDR